MTGDRIVPPIVVVEGRDIEFYESEDDVLSYIEPWYPSDAEYLAFDSEGRRLELLADPPVRRRRFLGLVGVDNSHESTLLIRAIETEPSGADELVALLREWLPRVGVPRHGPDDLPLDELLREAINRGGYTR